MLKSGNTTITGTDNELPNQQLIGSNSILTEALGDSRYLSSSIILTGTGSRWGGLTIALPTGSSSGGYSFAGFGATATGWGSVAIGTLATTGSEALFSTASGSYSDATGYCSVASGSHSTARGDASTASGWAANTGTNAQYAVASGPFATADGVFSVASGPHATAIGYAATASGYGSNASGSYSFAGGYNATAASYGEFVAGQYNPTPSSESATSWVPTDPLFEVGNGTVNTTTWAVTPSDALVVYKNGNATLSGTLTVAPGGDIPMFTGY